MGRGQNSVDVSGFVDALFHFAGDNVKTPGGYSAADGLLGKVCCYLGVENSLNNRKRFFDSWRTKKCRELFEAKKPIANAKNVLNFDNAVHVDNKENILEVPLNTGTKNEKENQIACAENKETLNKMSFADCQMILCVTSLDNSVFDKLKECKNSKDEFNRQVCFLVAEKLSPCQIKIKSKRLYQNDLIAYVYCEHEKCRIFKCVFGPSSLVITANKREFDHSENIESQAKNESREAVIVDKDYLPSRSRSKPSKTNSQSVRSPSEKPKTKYALRSKIEQERPNHEECDTDDSEFNMKSQLDANKRKLDENYEGLFPRKEMLGAIKLNGDFYKERQELVRCLEEKDIVIKKLTGDKLILEREVQEKELGLSSIRRDLQDVASKLKESENQFAGNDFEKERQEFFRCLDEKEIIIKRLTEEKLIVVGEVQEKELELSSTRRDLQDIASQLKELENQLMEKAERLEPPANGNEKDSELRKENALLKEKMDENEKLKMEVRLLEENHSKRTKLMTNLEDERSRREIAENKLNQCLSEKGILEKENLQRELELVNIRKILEDASIKLRDLENESLETKQKLNSIIEGNDKNLVEITKEAEVLKNNLESKRLENERLHNEVKLLEESFITKLEEEKSKREIAEKKLYQHLAEREIVFDKDTLAVQNFEVSEENENVKKEHDKVCTNGSFFERSSENQRNLAYSIKETDFDEENFYLQKSKDKRMSTEKADIYEKTNSGERVALDTPSSAEKNNNSKGYELHKIVLAENSSEDENKPIAGVEERNIILVTFKLDQTCSTTPSKVGEAVNTSQVNTVEGESKKKVFEATRRDDQRRSSFLFHQQ